MIDMAQADKTLRNNDKGINYYYVVCKDSKVYGSFDSQSEAIRIALKYDGQVVKN